MSPCGSHLVTCQIAGQDALPRLSSGGDLGTNWDFRELNMNQEILMTINHKKPTQEEMFLVFVSQNTLIVWITSRISNSVSMLG